MGRASARNGGMVKLMFRTRTLGLSLVVLSALLAVPLAAQSPQQPARPGPKRVLAWGDTLTAFQHDSISHALATMERLGQESGAGVRPGKRGRRRPVPREPPAPPSAARQR